MSHRKTMVMMLAGLTGLGLAIAWWDGGREEQRLIVQPVTLPELEPEFDK